MVTRGQRQEEDEDYEEDEGDEGEDEGETQSDDSGECGPRRRSYSVHPGLTTQTPIRPQSDPNPISIADSMNDPDLVCVNCLFTVSMYSK